MPCLVAIPGILSFSKRNRGREDLREQWGRMKDVEDREWGKQWSGCNIRENKSFKNLLSILR